MFGKCRFLGMFLFHHFFVQYLLAQKQFSIAATEHGKNMSLSHCENTKKSLKMGKPMIAIRSVLFVPPKIVILGCPQDAKVTDLSFKDSFGIREVKCP